MSILILSCDCIEVEGVGDAFTFQGERLDDLKFLIAESVEASERLDEQSIKDIASDISLMCDLNGLGDDDCDDPCFSHVILNLPIVVVPALRAELNAVGKITGVLIENQVVWDD